MSPKNKADSSDYDIEIKLLKDRNDHHPGEEISGTALIRLKKDAPLGTITVSLFGKSEVVMISRGKDTETQFKDSLELFNIESILNDDHYTHKKGDYEFSFSFDIPLYDQSEHSIEKYRPWEGFLNSLDLKPEHLNPLPPEMFLRKHTGLCHARVGYGVEIKIVPPTGRGIVYTKPYSEVKAISLVPQHVTQSVDGEGSIAYAETADKATFKSFRLSKQTGRRLSLKQRALSAVKSSQVPKLTIDLHIKHASSLSALSSTRIPFLISGVVDVNPNATTMQHLEFSDKQHPEIYVRSFELKLETITQCRYPQPDYRSDRHDGLSSEVPLISRRFTDLQIQLVTNSPDKKDEGQDHSIDLGSDYEVDITDPSKLTEHRIKSKEGIDLGNLFSLGPAFVSYNISRRHFLSWEVELECVGEKATIKSRSAQPITVLMPPDAPTTNKIEFKDEAFMTLQSLGLSKDSEQSQENDPPAYGDVHNEGTSVTGLLPRKDTKA